MGRGLEDAVSEGVIWSSSNEREMNVNVEERYSTYKVVENLVHYVRIRIYSNFVLIFKWLNNHKLLI